MNEITYLCSIFLVYDASLNRGTLSTMLAEYKEAGAGKKRKPPHIVCGEEKKKESSIVIQLNGFKKSDSE